MEEVFDQTAQRLKVEAFHLMLTAEVSQHVMSRAEENQLCEIRLLDQELRYLLSVSSSLLITVFGLLTISSNASPASSIEAL